jgi:magnesium-transporting ATPase (P-type)
MFWEVGVFTNMPLLAVVSGSTLLQLGLHYVPAAGSAFGIAPLSVGDRSLTLLAALVPVTAIELFKLARRLRLSRRGG